MNRLILVGNGFDLSVGLKSSYYDFFYNYLQSSILYGFNEIESNKEDYENHSYFYNDELINYNIPINHIPEYPKNQFSDFKDLRKFLQTHYEFKYKSLLLSRVDNRIFNYNWYDIEVMYYDLIIPNINRKSFEEREPFLKKYNYQFNVLKDKLVEYLSSITTQWNKEEEYTRYVKIMEDYHKDFFSKLFNNVNQPKGDKIMFVNFNYTSTLEDLFKWNSYDDFNFDIVPIHGQLNDIESIIFGFGDELDQNYLMVESKRSRELLKNIKSPHYFQSYNYKKLNKFINSGKDYEVYILGHSCGISDRTLLNEIFENNFCKHIRVFYHEWFDDLLEKNVNNKLEISVELIKNFKDKIKMRSKVKDFDEGDKMEQIKRLKPLPLKSK